MQLSEDPLRIVKRKLAHFEVPLSVHGERQRFESPNEDFKNIWSNIDFEFLKSLKLGGNSYSLKTLAWFAKNILCNCKNLEIMDMSSMFLDNPDNKTVENISDNAKGFFVLANTLKTFNYLRELNISNNSIGGAVILQALEELLSTT